MVSSQGSRPKKASFSPQALAQRVWDQPVNRIIELIDELQRTFEQEGLGQLEAIESALNLSKRVRDQIIAKINYYERKKVKPNFRFSETSTNRLIGIAVSEPDPEIKTKLRYRKELFEYISSINWKAFENLCAVLLKLAGFSRLDVGKRSKDGGLDYFGILPLDNNFQYSGCMIGENYRIFGQAKHRKCRPVTGEEVRVFFTKYTDFEGERGPAYKKVLLNHRWFIEAKGPLIAMLVTNTRFESDAEWFAEKEKVRLREGIEIVEDIVMLAKADDWLNMVNGSYVFTPDKFNQFLEHLGSKCFE